MHQHFKKLRLSIFNKNEFSESKYICNSGILSILILRKKVVMLSTIILLFINLVLREALNSNEQGYEVYQSYAEGLLAPIGKAMKLYANNSGCNERENVVISDLVIQGGSQLYWKGHEVLSRLYRDCPEQGWSLGSLFSGYNRSRIWVNSYPYIGGLV